MLRRRRPAGSNRRPGACSLRGGLQQVLFRLVAVLLEVFHEGRAAGADIGVVAGGILVLPGDVARRIFEMARAKARQVPDAGVVELLERRLARGLDEGAQARACAPLWALASYGPAGLAWVAEARTLAEGLRVSHPLRGDAVMQSVTASQGMFVAVDEEDIMTGRAELARRGLYVEPTSAVVWSGLAQVVGKVPEPIVVVLTGSGLKSEP